MNKLVKFNEFIFEKLFENTGGKLPFILSNDLKNLLFGVDHIISDELFELEDNDEEYDFTLVDIGPKNNVFTLTLSNKLRSEYEKEGKEFKKYDFILYHRYNQDEWNKFRTEYKIGRLIKKLFGDTFNDSEIESFVNIYKSEYDIVYKNPVFEIVEGVDIVKWYDYDNYKDVEGTSQLHNSCMAEEGCDDFLQFYKINSPEKVRMLVQFENEQKKKIVGRALLWNLDEPEKTVFMDRVYSINDHQIQMFKRYADNNGWIYDYDKLLIKDIKLFRYYPYLDTIYYLYQDNRILSNDGSLDIDGKLDIKEMPLLLNNTDGNVSNGFWSDFYKKYIHMDDDRYVDCELLIDHHDYTNKVNAHDSIRLKEDATYFKYYRSYAPNNLLKDHKVIKTTFGEEYNVLEEDAIWLEYYGEYTTERYVDLKMHYSDYYDDYVDEKDFAKSYNNDIIFLSKSETVYLNEDDALNKKNMQLIPEEEVGKLTYKKYGENILKLN
ncbi:MAG: hypothetical protein ACOC2W_03380 [bacterium]